MKRFRYVIVMELKKAFGNRFFALSLVAGLLFAVLSAVYSIDSYMDVRESLDEIGGNPMIQAFGLFNTWIGGESNTLGFTLFFTLLSLLAVLPYGWSYQMEEKSRYLDIVQMKVGRQRYMLAKYMAAFLSGGTCIVVPLLVNFLVVAAFVPAVQPTIIYEIYYPMHHGALLSELFFDRPVLFVGIYMLIDFVYGGLFAAMGIAISFFVKNRLAVVLSPFMLVLAFQYLRTFFYYRIYKEISPMYFLHAVTVENVADAGIVCTEAVILFLFTFVTTIWGAGKRENL